MRRRDRRVERTESALQRALIELILEKGFEATTTSEITERANVGRSTFYAHYADKEDLLQGSIDGLRAYLASVIAAPAEGPATDAHPALAFCRPMLEHAAENRPLFQAMVGRRSGQLLQELLHDMWSGFVREGWPDADEIAVQAIAGGFGWVVHWWMCVSPELGPAEVDRRFRALMEPVLEAQANA